MGRGKGANGLSAKPEKAPRKRLGTLAPAQAAYAGLEHTKKHGDVTDAYNAARKIPGVSKEEAARTAKKYGNDRAKVVERVKTHHGITTKPRGKKEKNKLLIII